MKFIKKIMMLLFCFVVCSASLGADPSAFNYAEALQKAVYFYMQQRSGDLPDDFPCIWRGDACLEDGADVGVDLSGGYFDAGDSVKFNLPMSASMLSLAVYAMEYRNALLAVGLYDEMVDAIRWGTDYIMACHPDANTYHFQVGNPYDDHRQWCAVEIIDQVTERPTYTVTNLAGQSGSTVCAAGAAALLAASELLKNEDSEYSRICLDKGRTLLALAENRIDDAYYDSINLMEGGPYYPSYGGPYDELSVANLLMYMRTGTTANLDKAIGYSDSWRKSEINPGEWRDDWVWDWDDMQNIAKYYMYRYTGDPVYKANLEEGLSNLADPSSGVGTRTANGQLWLSDWGSNRYAAGAAGLAALWGKSGSCTPELRDVFTGFAENQINYILGDNNLNLSYMIGFGEDRGKTYPLNPHHRTAHGTCGNTIVTNALPEETQHILYGALVGGPGAPDDQHNDQRGDYKENEVALDYNMGLIGALCYLVEKNPDQRPIEDFPRPQDFRPVEARFPEGACKAIIAEEDSSHLKLNIWVWNYCAWPAREIDYVTIRYYYDVSEIETLGYTVDDLGFRATKIRSPRPDFLSPRKVPGTDSCYFTQIHIPTSYLIPAGGGRNFLSIEFTIYYPDGWDSSNDWSYEGLSRNQEFVDKIPVYCGIVDLYGGHPMPVPSFSIEGARTVRTTMKSLGLNFKSENVQSLIVNGNDYANRFVDMDDFPEAINGKYYIQYTGDSDSSYFAAEGGEEDDIAYEPVSAPFTHDRFGECFWVCEDLPAYINSWNLSLLEINGVNLTNVYKHSYELPDAIDGKYYIHYIGEWWGHFEMGNPVDNGPSDYVPISSPFGFDGAGEYFWVADSIPDHINNWNMDLLTINGTPYTGEYREGDRIPAAPDGKYYIHFVGSYAWSHFELY